MGEGYFLVSLNNLPPIMIYFLITFYLFIYTLFYIPQILHLDKHNLFSYKAYILVADR